MYNLYLGNILCPVAPEKISVNYGNGCEVVKLADGGELGVPKGKFLREIEFSLLLPNSEYPFAIYNNGFCDAEHYLEKFEKLLRDKNPFQFIVIRCSENRFYGRGTNIKCLMESLRVDEDVKFGVDYSAKIKLREYKNFAAKKLDPNTANSIFKSQRSTENSPEPKNKSIFYRVVKDDCMWMLAQRFYGNGNLYDKIYQANKSKLAGRSPKYLIFVGDLLEIPPL